MVSRTDIEKARQAVEDAKVRLLQAKRELARLSWWKANQGKMVVVGFVVVFGLLIVLYKAGVIG